MSFCVVRMSKFKGSAIGGIQNHDLRARESHTNPDIDNSLSEHNYGLLGHSRGMSEAINARVMELSPNRKVRKDAVVCCGMMVTSDKVFFDKLSIDQQRAFFQDSFEFLKDRYGEKNVVAATVHMDEKTPHMHFYFVPEYQGRLSAKELFALPRKELEHLQTDFAREVGQKYGLERGREGSPAKHISNTRYKAQEAEKRAQAAEQKLKELEPRVLQAAEVDKIQGKKTLFGGLKGVSYSDYESLKVTAGRVDQAERRAAAADRRADLAEQKAAEVKNESLQDYAKVEQEREKLGRERAAVEAAKEKTPDKMLMKRNQELNQKNAELEKQFFLFRQSVRELIKALPVELKKTLEPLKKVEDVLIKGVKRTVSQGRGEGLGR